MATLILHVGSSAIRAIVATPTPDGWFDVLGDHRVALGFERAIRCTGEVGAGRRQLAEETVVRLRDAAFRWGADEMVGVVDAGLVAARDLDALVEAITNVLGVPLLIRSGTESVRLVVTAAARSLGVQEARPVVEVSDHQLRWSGLLGERTVRGVVPTGIEDLLAEHVDPLSVGARHGAAALVARLLRCPGVPALVPALPDGRPLVVSGAAAAALASSVLTRRWGPQRPQPEGVHVTRTDLDELDGAFSGRGPGERLLLPGVDPAEVDRVAMALLVLRELTQRVGADGVIVTHAEAYHGEVLDALGLIDHDGTTADPAADSAAASFTGLVFDRLTEIHGLGSDERDLLLRAARRTTGGSRGAGGVSHRRAARDVLDSGVRGVPPDRLVELACLVRFQRGQLPGPHFAPYGRLPGPRQLAVDRMTGILRLSAGLTAHYGSDVLDLEAQTQPGLLTVRPQVRDGSRVSDGAPPPWVPGIERLLGIGVLLRPSVVITDAAAGRGPVTVTPSRTQGAHGS